jgi:thymidylate synthase ThyX
MSHSAKILADSISPDGVRLTTMEVVIPRIVLAEFNTHRQFSRNSASSRAIPVEKMLKRVIEDPYVPSEFGRNQKGMQAGDALPKDVAAMARLDWLIARDNAVDRAKKLLERGVHKQLTNRLLEPWLWHTIIVSATEWGNFFHLRCHPHAHPDIRKTAELMREAMKESAPKELDYGDWHLPLVYDEDWQEVRDGAEKLGMEREGGYNTQMLVAVSVGRCARVSYLTHDGKRDLEEDVKLHDKLLNDGHMSPFEHVARPMTEEERKVYCTVKHSTGSNLRPFLGNFRGWVQYRKTIPNEYDIKGA